MKLLASCGANGEIRSIFVKTQRCSFSQLRSSAVMRNISSMYVIVARLPLKCGILVKFYVPDGSRSSAR